LGVLQAACATAWAQTTTPPELPRVEVTGNAPAPNAAVSSAALRTPVPLEQTPQSVVVLTRSLLDEQGVRTLTEALGNVASVRGTDARDQLNFGLRIRGFEAGVLVDGVALPGTFTTPDLLAGVSRVDVVKGPAGTLYGGTQAAGNGGFIGGVVALTTSAPEARPAASVGLRLGTPSQSGLAADVNLPLGETFAARLQAEASRDDSETDRVRPERLAIQPSVAWRPGRDTEVVLRWRHTENRALDYSGLPRKGTIEPAAYEVPRSRILTAEGLPDSTSELDALNLQWSQRLNDTWTWQVTLARVDARYDQRGTFALDSTTFTWPAVSALDGPLYGVFGARLWNRQTSTVL
jgi:iron complex outermembrane receptor protein